MTYSETSSLTDSFNTAADTYETRMGSAVHAVARHIASTLDLPPRASVCDNACGTGAVTQAILQAFPDAHVNATDNSAAMIRILSRLVTDHHWSDRVQTTVADSVKLPYAADTFDANLMSFGIFFTSDEVEAAREIYRTLKPGGKAIVTCWKASALFQIIFDVQRIIQPVSPLEGLPKLDAWCKEDTIKSVMQAGGFKDVTMTTLPVDLMGPTLDHLVTSCAENLKGIVGTQWTAEEKNKMEAATKEVLLANGHHYLSIDTADCKGVRWVAWIASASKQ